MVQRLKVFVTSDGLTDFVVAASSRAKALSAWGAHQDLFKTGGAHETDAPDLVAAATATPGEVLRRPAATGLAPQAASRRAKPRTPAGPSKAALRKVADLEQRLAREVAIHEAELADIDAGRAALDLRQAEAIERFEGRRAKLLAALHEARADLELDPFR